MATKDSSSSTIVLSAVGGALGARVLDEWVEQSMPSLKYKFALGGRDVTIRASTALALGVGIAAMAGVEIPGESVVLPLAAGALAYEFGAEVGDDVAALILGLPAPGAPQTEPLPPPVLPPPAGAAFYPGFSGYGVQDPYLQQAMQQFSRL